MQLNNHTNNDYTMRQLKLPCRTQKLISISNPAYTFYKVMEHINLSRYFVENGYKTDRPRFDVQKLLDKLWRTGRRTYTVSVTFPNSFKTYTNIFFL